MKEVKVDPRIRRTRKLIMDAFIELSSKKEFRDITVKDITAEAMINRATFYYHFEDIYDLLDKSLSEVLLVNLDCDTYISSELNEEVVSSIFRAITDFQMSLSTRCHRGYEDTIARIIREQLEIIFYHMLVKQRSNNDEKTLKLMAVMLSWGIYGASVEWKRSIEEMEPEIYIKSVIPFIMAGIDGM